MPVRSRAPPGWGGPQNRPARFRMRPAIACEQALQAVRERPAKPVRQAALPTLRRRLAPAIAQPDQQIQPDEQRQQTLHPQFYMGLRARIVLLGDLYIIIVKTQTGQHDH